LQRKKYSFFTRTSNEIEQQDEKELNAIMDMLKNNIEPIKPAVAQRIYVRLGIAQTAEEPTNEDLPIGSRLWKIVFGEGVGRKSHKKHYKKILKKNSTYKVRGA
jgi:hypothetical protein